MREKENGKRGKKTDERYGREEWEKRKKQKKEEGGKKILLLTKCKGHNSMQRMGWEFMH